ncbi:response regulator [Marinimicrobium alkaliphilum]|uniref:response regulator n=1 Tax=Marinimicrobium alkaliphilum TaxID=2202654 RepID=UPI000DB94BDC|nr:response regulator [Marinimicrobium alkaliphilum]
MFQLFIPGSKVQKDRQIMRDTDARVAKYSRRGLIVNFLVFILALAFGDFYQKQPTLAIVLVTGLLLLTLLRGYFLFRFDTLYARAPGRWRNQYFIASCLGAAWWSFILVSLTWSEGMRDETLIMWLYTVVFYSSVANVFAPYRRFLTIYLFIGQVPAAVTAIMLGYVDGYLYGSIMLVFYFMLAHQAKTTSQTYWERLEANYALRERAKGLENQQRSSLAAIELKNEFLVNLGHEFRSSLNDILGTLALVDESKLSERERELLAMASKASERQLDLVNNVVDFSKITTKSLDLDETVFDLRRQLEKLVQEFSLEAHQQGIELNYLFDPELPQRVRGDAARMGQVLGTLLSHSLKFASSGTVLVEANFNQDQSDSGELQVVISDSRQGRHAADDGRDDSPDETLTGIGLAICKGLAECMGGRVHIQERRDTGNRIVITLALEVVAHELKTFAEDARLRGKRVLLVDLPDTIAQDIADEIGNWGMQSALVEGFDQALEHLQASEKAQEAIDLVLIYNRLNSLNALVLSKELATHDSFGGLRQVIAMSVLQRDADEVHAHLRDYPQVTCIEKPIMRKRLHDVIVHRLLQDAVGAPPEPESEEAETPKPTSGGRRVLLVEEQRVSQMVLSGMLKKLGCYVQVSASGSEAVSIVEKDKFDLVLMDCDLPEDEGLSSARAIRALEAGSGNKQRLPVIALSGQGGSDEKSRCLDAGMDDLLAKPVRLDELSSRLNRWLAAR